MFTRPKDEPNFNVPINDLLPKLANAEPGTEEYQKLLNHLQQLAAIRDASRPKSLSQDAVVTAASSLLGILIIVGHERAHVVTSQAMKFIRMAK